MAHVLEAMPRPPQPANEDDDSGDDDEDFSPLSEESESGTGEASQASRSSESSTSRPGAPWSSTAFNRWRCMEHVVPLLCDADLKSLAATDSWLVDRIYNLKGWDYVEWISFARGMEDRMSFRRGGAGVPGVPGVPSIPSIPSDEWERLRWERAEQQEELAERHNAWMETQRVFYGIPPYIHGVPEEEDL